MNLAVTGKKMTTPNPPKKQPEQNSPFMIQSKPITQKAPMQTKPKPVVHHVQKPQTKKQQSLKVEMKKETHIKKEEKIEKKQAPQPKIQEKVEQNVKPEPQPMPQIKKQDVIGKVTVRYNHYKEDFSTLNSILSFEPIEQKYGFADVFKGKYLPVLKVFRQNEQIIPQTTGLAVQYSWKVAQGQQYKLEIREDEEEELKYQKKTYKASENKDNCPFKKNARFDELTEQMKKMDPSELGSEKHRALLQQRDLEDVLFS